MKLYRTLDECETKRDKKEWLINEIHAIIRTELGLKWHRDTLRGYLKELQDENYVISYEDKERRGHPYIYSLREKELKNISFCRFFVENPDQQKKLFINAIEDAEQSDAFIDSTEQKDRNIYVKEEFYKSIIGEKYKNTSIASLNRKIEDERGSVVFNPITEKIEFITSSDAKILGYIYKYSCISGSTDQHKDLTPENTPNVIKERFFCRADENNKTLPPDTTTEDGDSQPFSCICGESFSTTDSLKSISPLQEGTCERCDNHGFLDHEVIDEYQRCLVCSKCAEELKHEDTKKEDEVPKVRAGISIGEGIEYQNMGVPNND